MDELSALAVSGPVSRHHKCHLWRGKFLETGKVHDFSRMEIVDVTGESDAWPWSLLSSIDFFLGMQRDTLAE